MNNKLNPTNIVITRHAERRFTERFRLYFSNIKRTSTFLTSNLMVAQIVNGHIQNGWKDCPFYKNKLHLMYGTDLVVIKNGPVYYVCKQNSDKLVNVTCVAHWLV
jgi:hypothetical protein